MLDSPHSLRVILVDDSEEFLVVAGSWIETRPSLTLLGTARNGAEAQELVARLVPDLVIIDAFMPVMDGFAATRAIKAGHGPPWVVMVSVHEGATIEHEAWLAGADAFVGKADLALRMPTVIDGLRDGRSERPLTVEPSRPPQRRPDEAPIELRAMEEILKRLGVARYLARRPARTSR